MQLFLMISLLVVALLLVGIILIQQGKGAEMGASFGAGASNTLFGAPGAGNFLTKSTTILAILFFVIALAITFVKNNTAEESNILDDAAQAAETIETSTDTGLEAIPSANQEAATEIPTAAKETIGTEIPTATDVKDAVKAEADKAADAAEKKVEEIKKDTEAKFEDIKTDAEKKLEEAKKELKKKADGEQ